MMMHVNVECEMAIVAVCKRSEDFQQLSRNLSQGSVINIIHNVKINKIFVAARHRDRVAST